MAPKPEIKSYLDIDTGKVVDRMINIGKAKFGFNQTQLSLAITDYTNPSLVAGWRRRGQPKIQLETLLRAANALEVHPFALLFDATDKADKISFLLRALESVDEATLDRVLAAVDAGK